jgi:alpha-L-rhamnosidase
LNHYSKGAVVTFLHRYVAGIRPDEDAPGYRRFRIEPVVGGGLTSASATLDCPQGRIESSWTRSGAGFELRVVVPPGSHATVVLPDGAEHQVGPGSATLNTSV